MQPSSAELHSPAMFDWGDWDFTEVAEGLTLGNREPTRPPQWNDGIRSIEATVQTLLAFHLRTMTGLPLRLLRSARAIESSADLVATDSMKRVHLFELKKGPVNEQAASQIEKYLLRHVFADSLPFLAEARTRGKEQFTDFEVAKSILGVHANDRPEGFGLELVGQIDRESVLAQDLSGHRLTRTRWKRLSDEEKLIRIHTSLAAFEERSNRSTRLPDIEDVRRDASGWGDKLRKGLEPVRSGLLAERPLVIWLVGASVTEDALERVRLWRRAGVDARAMRVTARMRNGRWSVGVRRELAPARDEVEKQLLIESEKRVSPASVKAVFYDEVAPSTNRTRGGGVLEDPIIRIRK